MKHRVIVETLDDLRDFWSSDIAQCLVQVEARPVWRRRWLLAGRHRRFGRGSVSWCIAFGGMGTGRDPKPFDSTLNRMYNRVALDQLSSHLSQTYGVEVARTEQLDVGVIRVDRRDGPTWVARIFSTLRPASATEGDAAILRHLQKHEFPAERLAAVDPVSSLEGQQVLVTEFVPSAKRKLEPDAYEIIGRLQARLHALPLPRNEAARPAGALHHFEMGSRRDELDAAAAWLDQVEERVPGSGRPHLDKLRHALSVADDGVGLPQAVIHPDPVPKNMVRTDSGYTYVDWTGAGVGPRVVSLAWILSPRIIAGYEETAAISDEEWDRLPGVIYGRKLIDLCFGLCLNPERATSMVKRIGAIKRDAKQRADQSRVREGRTVAGS